jgi:hypothetical protein
MQAQHRARVSLNQETPLIWTAILDAKTAVIQAASGNKATSLRRLLAINPSLTQTVSPHMRRGLRLILGLAQRETSMLRFSLHPTTLPLTNSLSWRLRNWFFAMDQDGNRVLSADELRTYSKIHSRALLNYITGSALLTNGSKTVFFFSPQEPRPKAHWSPISRHAALAQHGEISHEHRCTSLPESFQI